MLFADFCMWVNIRFMLSCFFELENVLFDGNLFEGKKEGAGKPSPSF
jgi:hypothetical protein